MSFITSILEQGLIYGILALGIYITYKILDFPDLTWMEVFLWEQRSQLPSLQEE